MDRFDIMRDQDAAAGEAVDSAMDLLEADKDKTRERNGRLIRLDIGHYYDPKDGWVLVKEGSQYKELHRNLVGKDLGASTVEAEALGRGFRRVKAGLYWNGLTRHLYVQSDGSYSLFSVHASPVEA